MDQHNHTGGNWFSFSNGISLNVVLRAAQITYKNNSGIAFNSYCYNRVLVTTIILVSCREFSLYDYVVTIMALTQTIIIIIDNNVPFIKSSNGKVNEENNCRSSTTKTREKVTPFCREKVENKRVWECLFNFPSLLSSYFYNLQFNKTRDEMTGSIAGGAAEHKHTSPFFCLLFKMCKSISSREFSHYHSNDSIL